MRITSKPPGLRIVGGTAYGSTVIGIPIAAQAQLPEPPRLVIDPTATETAKNGKLREQRKQAWRAGEAATRYWRLRLDFESALSIAQSMEIPEGRYHPVVDRQERYPMVGQYREAEIRQRLTPAPDTRSVAWKQMTLASRQFRHSGVKPERIERAIADDLAFLAAHPTRRDNSEAIARRREFKEAMRRRIRDVAAARDLSDEEIKPALTLKHQEIARFSEQHGVNIKWLLGGDGAPDRGGRCELMDMLDGGGKERGQ
jgi:hypothetical protein